MKVDLTNANSFAENEISFDKNINFVFEKNGTGKSTIAELIQEQNLIDDVRVFHGFEGVIDENKRLNAVVLGEFNKEINNKIKTKLSEIEKKNEDIEKITIAVSKPEDDSVKNFWTEFESAEKKYNKKYQKIEQFYKASAAIIKNKANPQISHTSYDTRYFQAEISKQICCKTQK